MKRSVLAVLTTLALVLGMSGSGSASDPHSS
jgi:hypothetical protein